MADDRRLSISGRNPPGSSGGGSGKVRQSFSHGRSKPVVVERKKRRILKKAPDAKPEREAAEPEAEEKTEEARENLTTREMDTRAEAVKDAIRQAEEDRMRAAKLKREREADEDRRRREEEARSQEERQAKSDEDAKRKVEEEAKARAEAAAAKRDEEARVEAERQAELAESKAPRKAAKGTAEKVPERELEPDHKERKGDRKKASHRPSHRHTDDRRRSGKLTIAKALEGGDEYRPRSLAAYRRAQAKQRRTETGDEKKTRRTREVIIPDAITVQELANRMAEKAAVVIRTLMDMDVMATINDTLDPDTAELVATELGHKFKRVSEADVEIGFKGEEDEAGDLQPRAPVVTVMGHVDHGKTSLLDALRKTNVTAGEAGGITQHIGAYQVTAGKGQKITFLDTPGHEAFTAMRARGASVTDIVILVVAADDGVMPQTVEAINHAKAAKVPIIVAINKIDKTGANPDKVRQELLQHEIVVESLSGDVLDVEVSATKGTGLDKLLEAIALQAELLELKANPDRPAEGVVIEAQLEKGRGSTATVLVSRGTLRVGDILVAGSEWGRVRALLDEHQNQIDEVGPSQPAVVLGLNGTPGAGDEFAVVDSEGRARELTAYRSEQKQKARQAMGPVSLETMFSALKEQKAVEYPLVIKADVQGSLEAISAALEKLGNEEIRALVIQGGVGGITESDVYAAAASNAVIIGFNVRANRQAKEAAETEGVAIEYFSVIYDLVDTVKSAMEGQLSPEVVENVIGMAEVKETFTAGKLGRAAGCIVNDGVARANAKARLLRDDVVVYTGAIASLRRFKDDVKEVKAGTECGIALENYQDIKVGDQIEIFETEERKRTL